MKAKNKIVSSFFPTIFLYVSKIPLWVCHLFPVMNSAEQTGTFLPVTCRSCIMWVKQTDILGPWLYQGHFIWLQGSVLVFLFKHQRPRPFLYFFLVCPGKWFSCRAFIAVLLLFCRNTYKFLRIEKHFQAKHNFDYWLLCESFVG